MLLFGARVFPLIGSVAFLGAGCSSNDEPYKVVPAFSGRKANLPGVPTLPSLPIKQGDAFTIYGAIHHLNSTIHQADVVTKEITLVGYISEMNLKPCPEGQAPKMCAPVCAIHKTGKADPEGCTTEIPTLVLTDAKGDTATPWKIRVMGFSSNFANVFEAYGKYKLLKEAPVEDKIYKDVTWATDFPWPMPNVGAKVKITGKYGVNFQKASSGIESDPRNGIMTFQKMETVEEAPEKWVFEVPKK